MGEKRLRRIRKIIEKLLCKRDCLLDQGQEEFTIKKNKIESGARRVEIC